MMKAAKYAMAAVTAGVSIGFVSPLAHAQGKTREQVREELIMARHDGSLPMSKNQYPPTEETMARNREIHAASMHPGEKSPDLDRHDQLAAR